MSDDTKIDRAAEAAFEVQSCVALPPEQWTAQATAIIRDQMDAEIADERQKRRLANGLYHEALDEITALRARLADAEKRLEEARELVDYVFCSTDGCPHEVCHEAEAKAWIAAHDAAGKRGGA